jgi:cell division protein FtsN
MATDVEMSGGPVAGTNEPSYYEIALTNRQVVVAFVILLTCLLAAFLSGVWIGRESTARSQERLAQAAGAPVAQAPREGQAVEEFQFFKEDEGKKGGKKGRGEATAPEPVEEAAPPVQGSPLEEPQPAATPDRPALFTEREPEVRRPPAVPPVAVPAPIPVAPKPAERPKPTPPATAETPGRAAPLSAPAAGAGKLVIQVFSSPDKDQADKIRNQLVAGGQKAFLSPIRGSGRTMYRVRLGPYDSRDQAEKVAQKVRKDQRLDTWITPQ